MQQAAADYPSIVSVSSIGKSARGLDIWMAKVSDNVADGRGGAGGAGRRPAPRAGASDNRAGARAPPLADTRLRHGRDGHAPRGHARDVHHLRPQSGRHALRPHRRPYRAWRKNLQRDAAGNAMYTDLNRNYAYRWGCCRGSSGKRSSGSYRGPGPFSAPETRALRDFVNGRVVDGVQQIRTHVTLHTNGQLILWPYGYTQTNIPSDMTALDHGPGVAGARDGGPQRLRRQAVVGPLHHRRRPDRLDVREVPDLLVHLRAVPDREGHRLGRPLPRRFADRRADRAQPAALLHLIDRAACPYADLGGGYAAADCGPLFDDLEINRGWVRECRRHGHGDVGPLGGRATRSPHRRAGPSSSARRSPGAARWSPAPPPAPPRARTTSTAAPRRSGAA